MMSPMPNVVVILADDMGSGDLGCYGATKIPTPAMDRLATEGVRLTDCHSPSAVCTPSRYGLLTGRYAWRGPLKEGVLRGYSPPIIEPTRPTLASILRTGGYATGAFGKWHLGLGWRRHDGTELDNAFSPDQPLDPGPYSPPDVDHSKPFTGGPCTLGFDHFFGMAGSLDMPPYCFLSQDHVLDQTRSKTSFITSKPQALKPRGGATTWSTSGLLSKLRPGSAAVPQQTDRSCVTSPYRLLIGPVSRLSSFKVDRRLVHAATWSAWSTGRSNRS